MDKKRDFGQINLPQPAENQEPASVSFAEIPVITEQRETAPDAYADTDVSESTGAVGDAYCGVHSFIEKVQHMMEQFVLSNRNQFGRFSKYLVMK